MVKKEYKPYNLTLNENVVEELRKIGYNISKLVRILLKEKLEKEKEGEDKKNE